MEVSGFCLHLERLWLVVAQRSGPRLRGCEVQPLSSCRVTFLQRMNLDWVGLRTLRKGDFSREQFRTGSGVYRMMSPRHLVDECDVV